MLQSLKTSLFGIALMALAAGNAHAQYGLLGNGSLDPFNKNNNLGGYIKLPTGKQNNASSFSPVSVLGSGRFRYSTGAFTDQGNGQWTEQRDDGSFSNFIEIARTGDYYELFDQQRRLKVRLLADKGIHQGANGRWVMWPGSEGSWEQGIELRGRKR